LKNIRLHERVRLQLRAEAFNLLNHANFDLNSIYQLQNINDANFGRSTVTAVAARVMQFGVRLEF